MIGRYAKGTLGIILIFALVVIFLLYIEYTLTIIKHLTTTSHKSIVHLSGSIFLRICIFYFTFESIRMTIKTLSGAFFYSDIPNSEEPYEPLVNVIIPAWNEEVGVEKTVRSVLNNDYENIKIIIVNDGSTDNTRVVAERLVSEFSDKVTLKNQRNGGKGTALNTGIKSGTGDIIVNIDADSYIHSDAVSNLVKHFKDSDVQAVVGTVVIGNRKSWIGKMQFFEYLFGFHLRRTQSVFNSIFILSGAMCAYRRTAYEQVEGFRDYSRTEDMDFTLQLRQKNFKIVYAHDATCVTEGASDFRGLINQRTRWQYGALSCFIHHKNLFLNSKKTVALSFSELPFAVLGYANIIFYPLIMLIAIGVPLYTQEYIWILLMFLAIPLNFLVVLITCRSLRKYWIYLILLSILMNMVMVVEFIAILKAIQKQVAGAGLQWTNWDRVGAS